MKNNNKGFTLIELLAIIVILAIIAVITVPIILGIIDNAKKGAARNSVIGYGKAVELAYTQYQYEENLGTPVTSNGATSTGKAIEVSFGSPIQGSSLKLDVNFDGDKVVCETANITDGKVKLTGCVVSDDNSTTWKYDGGDATEETH